MLVLIWGLVRDLFKVSSAGSWFIYRSAGLWGLAHIFLCRPVPSVEAWLAWWTQRAGFAQSQEIMWRNGVMSAIRRYPAVALSRRMALQSHPGPRRAGARP